MTRRPRLEPPTPRDGEADLREFVDRRFASPDPDQLWVTEHRTALEGKLYCCVVLNTF